MTKQKYELINNQRYEKIKKITEEKFNVIKIHNSPLFCYYF